MRHMGGKVGVSPGLDDNLPMARRWIWSFKLEHLPGDGHLPLSTNMLTVKDQGLASAGYQRCRVPGDWVERSGWDSGQSDIKLCTT